MSEVAVENVDAVGAGLFEASARDSDRAHRRGRFDVAHDTSNSRHVMEHPKLIYIERGSIVYRFEHTELNLRGGAMLYRPAMTIAWWDVVNRDGCVLCFAEFKSAVPDIGEVVWTPKCDQELEYAAFKRLRSAATVADEESQLKAQGELKAVLARFFRRAVNPLADDVKNATSSHSAEAAVRNALSYLGQHLREPDLLSRLHEIVGLSDDHLRRVFRQHVGMSSQQYLLRLRMMTLRRRRAHSFGNFRSKN